MKTAPLTLEDLKGSLCQAPGCNSPAHYLHARCHKSRGLDVRFDDEGYLELSCSKCKLLVTRVAVARKEAAR